MRESASFVPNVDALKIIFCHTCVLIKKQCPFRKHNSVSSFHIHWQNAGNTWLEPGKWLCFLCNFCCFSDPYNCSSCAPLLLQYYSHSWPKSSKSKLFGMCITKWPAGDLQEKLNSSQVKDSSIIALQPFQPPSPIEQVSDLPCTNLLAG